MNSTAYTVAEEVSYVEDEPPVHLINDYIEMIFLGLVVIVGMPLNVFVLKKLLEEKKRTPKDCVKGCFILLKIHLNISDILILLTQALGKFTWIATYQWIFGDILCRFFNFSNMFSLYLSSNIVICIAFDRLRNVIFANRLRRGKHTVTTMRIVIFFAWLLAAMWSVPQLYVWNTIDVYPSYPGGWVQCTDMWTIDRFLYGPEVTKHRQQLLSETAQNIYNISHLILVFFGPVALLALSYAFILARLMHYSYKMPQKFQPNLTSSHAAPSTVLREAPSTQWNSELISSRREVCDRPNPHHKRHYDPKVSVDSASVASTVTGDPPSSSSNELSAKTHLLSRQIQVRLSNCFFPSRRGTVQIDFDTQTTPLPSARPLLRADSENLVKTPRISVTSDCGEKLKKFRK
uniref:G_PROTEIN_RECEP_F1_2 domain-containing protein n=1 Tax=Steinernema glaseri TaxID=37863 RepID=A0A1I7YQ31_9BILA